MAVSTKKNVLGGKYRLEKVIGKGGSGCVYLAVDYALGKLWAVKELSKKDAIILNEVEMLRTLEHPLLPRIIDRVETQEKVYLVMDYLKGANLHSILRSQRDFSISQVINIGLQLCDVLGYLHTHEPPIIYCDMKPSNILLMPKGQIRLIDFGSAHFYRKEDKKSIVFALSKGFAAPEQYEGQATIASDIHGLGATLAAICPSKTPRKIKKLFAKCQRLNPRRRYKTVTKLAKALRNVQHQKQKGTRVWKMCLIIPLIGALAFSIGKIMNEARNKAYVEALAMSQYESAIELFPDESKPYLEILKEYQNQGKTADGIQKVENLLNIYANDEREKQQVYLAIGKLYFNGNIIDDSFVTDYELAEQYFAKVEDDVYSHIEWYQDMTRDLNDFGSEIDWSQMHIKLRQMEEMCMTTTNAEEKIAGLYAMSTIYVANRYYLADDECDPLSESTRLLEMCRSLLNESTSTVVKAPLWASINLSLARNYIMAGLPTFDKELLHEGYELYEETLDNITQLEQRLNVIRKMAYVEQCRGNYQNASMWYEQALAEKSTDIETYCQFILMKLLEEKDIEAAKRLFEKVSKISGCEKNRNYQIIKIKMEAILWKEKNYLKY